MSDFFEDLQALEEEDFFEALDTYDPVPRGIGDTFVFIGMREGNQVFEIVRMYDQSEMRNNVIYTKAGSAPDENGYYDYVGSISEDSLQVYYDKGWLKKK